MTTSKPMRERIPTVLARNLNMMLTSRQVVHA